MAAIKKHDPVFRVVSHKSFTRAKKSNYLLNLLKQGNGAFPKMKIYEVFVKSGEVNTLKQKDPDIPVYID